MRTREFPVLSAEEEPLVARLELVLGTTAARVMAYLLRRDDGDSPADRLSIRVGTGANRTAVSDALGRLEDRDLVTTTTLDTDTGRPPTAWTPRWAESETVRRADWAHADALLTQATVAARELRAAELSVAPTRDADTGDDATGTHADATLDVGLSWFPNVLHAPLFGAQSAGCYAAWGLDVSLASFAGSDCALDALAAGEVDVAMAGAATIVRNRDRPLVPLAPLYQRAMTVLYTTREAFGGPLTGVDSIRGKRVGMPIGAETGALSRLFLSQSGTLDDVDVVDLSGEERDALSSGRADVVTGSVLDPRELADANEVDVIRVADHFPIYGPTFVTTEDVLAASPTVVARFLAGTVAGWHHARTDPAAAVRAVEELDSALERATADLEYVIETFGTSNAITDHGWGWHDAAGWRRLATALAQADLFSGVDR
jgi:ABC-type nitrate/sulfonate/bicarbonate transport system substrate-binding protein